MTYDPVPATCWVLQARWRLSWRPHKLNKWGPSPGSEAILPWVMNTARAILLICGLLFIADNVMSRTLYVINKNRGFNYLEGDENNEMRLKTSNLPSLEKIKYLTRLPFSDGSENERFFAPRRFLKISKVIRIRIIMIFNLIHNPYSDIWPAFIFSVGQTFYPTMDMALTRWCPSSPRPRRILSYNESLSLIETVTFSSAELPDKQREPGEF